MWWNIYIADVSISSMAITLTPGQAVYIHGWINAKRSLTWSDMREKTNINFKLLTRANLSLGAIHHLQPDVVEWVKLGKMDLDDCPVVSHLWGAHPIKHFHADLGDIVSSHWPPEQLVRMGVTYQDLVGIGLTPENMKLFTNVTLTGWSSLGFTKEHATKFSESQIARVFGMAKNYAVRGLRPE